MTGRILISLLIALAPLAATRAATPHALPAPKFPATTVMERRMEDLRRELVALAGEAREIRTATDPDERRALLGSHLARLRDTVASLRAMESRMHEALDQGHLGSDLRARARHEFLLDHIAQTLSLAQGALADPKAHETERTPGRPIRGSDESSDASRNRESAGQAVGAGSAKRNGGPD